MVSIFQQAAQSILFCCSKPALLPDSTPHVERSQLFMARKSANHFSSQYNRKEKRMRKTCALHCHARGELWPPLGFLYNMYGELLPPPYPPLPAWRSSHCAAPWQAKEVPWQFPTGRSFEWYVDMCKVFLDQSRSKKGWYYRTTLWNLVFLQKSDGSFDITPALATALHAGDTSESISTVAGAAMDPERILESVPEVLDQYVPDKGLNQRMWATILAVERYKRLPFGWTINPEDLPSEQRTLEEVAMQWVNANIKRLRVPQRVVDEAAEVANQLVDGWITDRATPPFQGYPQGCMPSRGLVAYARSMDPGGTRDAPIAPIVCAAIPRRLLWPQTPWMPSKRFRAHAKERERVILVCLNPPFCLISLLRMLQVSVPGFAQVLRSRGFARMLPVQGSAQDAPGPGLCPGCSRVQVQGFAQVSRSQGSGPGLLGCSQDAPGPGALLRMLQGFYQLPVPAATDWPTLVPAPLGSSRPMSIADACIPPSPLRYPPLTSVQESMSEEELRQKKRDENRQFLQLVAASHPYVAIYYGRFTDTFSRAQRGLVLASSMLVMLFTTLYFSWNKGNNCCNSFKEWLGCEVGGTECWSYTTCQELYTAQEDKNFPRWMYSPPDSEATSTWNDPDDWVCTAFPSDTIMDKVYVMVYTLVMQLPPVLLLTTIFTLGNTPVIPAFWSKSKKYKKLMRGTQNTRVELALYFVLTFLLDTQRLSRALARYFLVLASVVFKSMGGIRRTLDMLQKANQRNRHTMHFLWETRVRGRNANWVFQEMESEAARKSELKLASLATEGAFQVESTHMDSLLLQMGYVLIFFGWGVLMMYLLTYSVAIADTMGKDEETAVLGNWVVFLIIDQFGIHVVKTLCIKVLVQKIMTKLQERAKGEAGLVTWYEMYIMTNLQTKYTLAGDELDTTGAMYDSGGATMMGMDLF
ncbi:hypothetical protein CYMTET_18642 [Cymbomonas tetramitiformis]|uniref:Uncharacterized protein n=1 Tax=Cymbomonas tetramitiformis TaxID=36881 RepID=A0AAE0G7W5_9CHLO|nr:hypothetical protein CYMTET_18642 [Cymbomonas tetramitiformis]